MEKLKSQIYAPFSENSLFRQRVITSSKSKLTINYTCSNSNNY